MGTEFGLESGWFAVLSVQPQEARREGERMIIDGRHVERGSSIEADLCIVGGGPAGITLALQFLNAETSVVLLESGGIRWHDRTQELADFEVEGTPYFPPKETRIRMLGGSTEAWGGICTQLDPIDFEQRPWVPNSGWPFPEKEIEPYYGEAYRLCGVSPPDSEPETLSGDSAGAEWTPLVFSAPARFGRMYGPTIRKAGNIRAFLHSSVTELVLHPNGGQIDGLRVACLGRNSYRVRARYYVLAGGGIENARLLLISNGVAKAGIGNDHDVVGRFFGEHPRVKDRYGLPSGPKTLAAHIPTNLAMLSFSRLRLAERVQRQEELLNYQANLYFGYAAQDTEQWEALRRIVFAVRRRHTPFFPEGEGGRNVVRWRDIGTAMIRPDHTITSFIGAALRPERLRCWVEVMSSVEQPPLPHNRVVLSDKTDDLGVPLPKLIWSISEQEERTYRRGLNLVLDELEHYSPGIRNARINDTDPWPGEIIGTWHHIGTTRMHEDPRSGVVDSNCRVHGVRNLYIAGSSVFPTGGAHSPTLTIIVLALRLADHLKSTSSVS